MSISIKICCIRTVEEAQLAFAAGADAIGMVGARPPSPRTIPDAEIATIARALPAQVRTFVLSTASSAEEIAAQVARTHVNAVQVLDHITAAESERLAALIPDIWRVQVVHVEGTEALGLIPRYSPFVSAFLLDSGKPSAPAKEYGGTGRLHDWTISAEFVRRSPKPTFLAGGLTAANAVSAIKAVRPFGLDLCSGVRTDGRLDAAKLDRFIAAVREAEADPAALAHA
jgi:phosphoribosylanthranilate isomerase